MEEIGIDQQNVSHFSVLKSIEFSNSSGGDEVDGDVSKTKSLEMLLLEKNKTLQAENTQLKVNCNDVSGRKHLSHDCHVTSNVGHMTTQIGHMTVT